MNRGTRYCALIIWVLSLALAACASAPPPIPSPSAKVPARIASPTPLFTATLVPSPTVPSGLQFISEIPLRSLPAAGHAPQALAILNGRVYVANGGSDNVSVIEGERVTAIIPVGDKPVALAADEKTGLVYVANEGDNSISFVSGYEVVKTVPGVKSPACLAALDGHLYVGGRGDSTLAVLDGCLGERITLLPLPAPIGILALAVNPATRLLYASVYDSVQIVDLGTMSIAGELRRQVYLTLEADPVHGGFFISEYDAANNTHYLVNYAAFGQQELGRVPVGGDPRGVAVNAEDGRVYVANSWTNDVSVIEGGTSRLLATVSVGSRPLDVAVDKEGLVYVVNADSENVAILDGETGRLRTVVPLSLLPYGMAVDGSTGRLYVACASTNSVFVLENQHVVSEVPVGLHPTEVALSADDARLFVLNHVSGDLSVISTSDHRVLRIAKIGQSPQGLAVAPEVGQLYVNDVVLDVDSQRLLRQTELLTMYRSLVKPIQIAVDAKMGRAYMVAFNGMPGSNGGFIIYVVDLESGELIPGAVGGLSTTDMVLDAEGQRVFSTAGRFGYFQLIANDAVDFQQVAVVDLPRYPAALAYNPKTQHIFVCLASTLEQSTKTGPELWVFDSRGFGLVAQFPLPSGAAEMPDPYNMVVDAQRGYVYLADRARGTVHVLRDVALPPPPSPTPTGTPTPWPTLTPLPEASPTSAAQPSGSMKRGGLCA